MTHSITLTPPSQVLLRLWFDADQHGSDLGYSLSRVSPSTPEPQPSEGVHASGLYFAPGEQLLVQVTGSGAFSKSNPNSFDSFQIIDCVIITRPQVIQRGAGLATQYAAPSPFLQAISACYPLALDFYATVNTLHSGKDTEPYTERVVTQTWKRTLDVGVTPGLWDLSLVMTVRIKRAPGAVEEVRVLSFDPETEVGSTGTLKL